MADLNGGQVAAKQLVAAGIDTVFGVVAGPMIELFAGLEREGVKVVACRHEESAAFMASAWGYLKKKPGVVIGGSGPGTTNIVTPMYVATASAMPLVVLGGSADASTRGLGGFQEADQVAFSRPGCKWTAQVDRTSRIPELVHLALGHAVSGRPGATYLDFPANVVRRTIPEESLELRTRSPHITAPHPSSDGVEAIAAMLATAERPLILIGKGAAWADAGPALQELVALGIPFVASPMGRGVVPDDSPYCVNAARSQALAGADAILMMGGRFNWIFQHGRPPRYAAGLRIAQVDIEPEEFTNAADVEIGLFADCAVAAAQIAEALRGRRLASAASGWVAGLRDDAARNEAAIAEQMDSDQQPINHYRLLREVRDVLPANSTVAVDAELTMGVARVVLTGFVSGRQLNSGTTGCMGTGVPYAIGAALAHPDEPAVAVVGDYAFGAAGIEVETAARVGANVVIVVSNNAGVAGHSIQGRMFAADAPPIAAMLPAHYEKMAEMVGGFARRVEDPADIRPAIEAALAARTVAVINVLTDPDATRRGAGYLG